MATWGGYHRGVKHGTGILLHPDIGNDDLIRQINACRLVAQHGPNPASSVHPIPDHVREQAKQDAAAQLPGLLAEAQRRNIQGV
jgi:hypothetical protein